MSQIASFYLLKNNQRKELSNGDCSGAVYMAIWDWCESELDLDVRFPPPTAEQQFSSCENSTGSASRHKCQVP